MDTTKNLLDMTYDSSYSIRPHTMPLSSQFPFKPSEQVCVSIKDNSLVVEKEKMSEFSG